jgi:hypothetical protein
MSVMVRGLALLFALACFAPALGCGGGAGGETAGQVVARSVGQSVVAVSAHSNNPAAAAVITGTGAVLYATAGGCKISGCPTGTYCNVASERCIRTECDASNEREVCVAGTYCELRTGSCVAF